MPRNRGRGSWAEKVVAGRYRRAGYRVRRNVLVAGGEVDVLAEKGGKVVVAEVKSGRRQRVGAGAVDKLVAKAMVLGAVPVLWVRDSRQLLRSAKKRARELGVRVREYGRRPARKRRRR